MSEIDLIPQEFRETVARLRDVRLAVGLAILLGSACIAAGVFMSGMAERLDETRVELARQRALSEQQGAELTRLSGERDRLLKQRDALTRLRGGAVVTELMLTIDRALASGDIWFLDWSFRRAGTESEDEVETNGYFIVAKENAHRDSVRTHMSITGQAVDHAALSRFVRGLFGQPQVQDVRVRQTTVRRYPTHSIVDFEVAVILRTRAS